MRDSFGALLADALAGMTRDAPACAEAMSLAIGATRVLLSVDRERMVLHSDGPTVRLTGANDPTASDADATTLCTTSSTLLDVLDGRRSMLSAVWDNAIRIRAAAVDAARLFDAVQAFVEGVARSSNSTSSYERFRRYVAGAPAPCGGGR